jgi:hypothetical protein
VTTRRGKGNKILKRALFISALAALKDPPSVVYHDPKRTEGKRRNQTLIGLARHRCDTLYAMLRDGTFYVHEHLGPLEETIEAPVTTGAPYAGPSAGTTEASRDRIHDAPGSGWRDVRGLYGAGVLGAVPMERQSGSAEPAPGPPPHHHQQRTLLGDGVGKLTAATTDCEQDS